MLSMNFYKDFEEKVRNTKRKILEFLIHAKNDGKQLRDMALLEKAIHY